jgi:hypothetical protein
MNLVGFTMFGGDYRPGLQLDIREARMSELNISIFWLYELEKAMALIGRD